jgi:penicillin-insensitive murein endopeptidase
VTARRAPPPLARHDYDVFRCLPWCCFGFLLSACFGTPTPLAPAVTGSVGMPYNGVQTSPAELPPSGNGFVRFRPKGPNYWGNPRLVRAVSDASANVAGQLPGGAPLVIGDFSARPGGKILGHNSHRSGRDVDLLFYVTTPSGAPVRSPGFVSFGADGIAQVHGELPPRFLRFDVEREWLLVKELLSSPEIGVQFMFISRDIEALLIDYARAKGEAIELIWRAETVLLEPGDSTPHDDHIHLRIACSPEEAVTGCEGGGPLWDWLPEQPRLLPLSESALTQIAEDDPPSFESVTAEAAGEAGPSATDEETGGGA